MKKWLVLLTFLVLIFKPNFCQAATNSVTVTASIPDKIPPTAPILVAPENGAYIANSTPTFIFKKSTDAQSPVRHYQMYLNNALFITEVPSSQTPVEVGMFLAIITDTNISVSLKQPLTDGVYSWKIRAYDMYGNWVDSASWTFTIDTQPPFIIISQIGENTGLNLSSQDLNTIPSGLQLETLKNKPEISGRSEPGAKIQITLTSTLGLTLTLTTVADQQGKFSLTPSLALQPGLYTILAIASDAAGNTTVLPEFNLLVKQAPAAPLLPPTLLKKPQALIQMPQPTPAVPAYLKSMPYLALLFLLLWLITAKIAFGFSWSILPQFLKLIIVPPLLTKKLCFSFNNKNKKAAGLVVIKINQQKILSNKKGWFNLSLNKGVFKLIANRAGFLPTAQNLVNHYACQLALCLPLTPNIKNYKKYQFIYLLAVMFLIFAVIFALISLIFLPNIINFVLAIICLDLALWFLV